MKGRWTPVPYAPIGKRGGTSAAERAARDQWIATLCLTHPVAEVARLTGFSRMWVNEICRKILQKRVDRKPSR